MSLRNRILPQERLPLLKNALDQKRKLVFMEAHNGLSAVVVNTTQIETTSGETRHFDGIWISSLTDSAAKAHPDTGVIDPSSRLDTIQQILHVTDIPIIVDGDTGGEASHFEYFCSKLENIGVSAVIIEDKQFPKRNSLDAGAMQILEDPKQFAHKVNRAKRICLSKDFMIFTRIESFIAGLDLKDALMRAKIYFDSDADGLLIHSSAKTPDEIYAFIDAYKDYCAKQGHYKPVVCVPTTYNKVFEDELYNRGFDIIIHANHLLRAAHKSMRQLCQSILINRRTFESSNSLSPIDEIFKDVGFLDVKAKDQSLEISSELKKSDIKEIVT